jgi:hypothetical protein
VIKKRKDWNFDPDNSTSIARLLSELEGVSYFLDRLGEEEEYNYILNLRNKYYKLYFQLSKQNAK